MHAQLVNKQKLVLFHLGETFAAVHRSVRAGLEREFRFSAATCANCDMGFSLGFAGVFSHVAAVFTSLRFVLESSFSIKFLFADSENEFLAAVFAYDGFVLIH
jgi:hypothetical protein